jgi:hypothetical protein
VIALVPGEADHLIVDVVCPAATPTQCAQILHLAARPRPQKRMGGQISVPVRKPNHLTPIVDCKWNSASAPKRSEIGLLRTLAFLL